MSEETRIVAPGPSDRSVRTADDLVLQVPTDWELLPPGDAALTRRVKAAGPTWTVQEKKGRKTFSRGVWAPADRIAAIRSKLEAERSTDAYAKRREADTARRDRKHAEYVEDFRAVTEHATPVGSGTVARTQRIPIDQRAESAVMAWMRHQTTAYENMQIPRVKGKRREVRRKLAEESRRLLEKYRRGQPSDASSCPLQLALTQSGLKEIPT